MFRKLIRKSRAALNALDHWESGGSPPGPSETLLPSQNLSDCHVLPSRHDLLRALPQNGNVAEIGVADGDFSEKILAINKPAHLALIDSWADVRYREGYDRVRTRFANLLVAGRVSIHRGLSTVVLDQFPDAYFDWVYIDTDHTYETTAAELRVCAQKVRRAGRIAGHDFSPGNVWKGWPYGVIQATKEFCVERGWGFEYLTLDSSFSFCLRRLSAQPETRPDGGSYDA